MKWTYQDNYDFTYKVLDEYVKKLSNMRACDFIKNCNITKFSKGSLRRKLQNTKWLMDNCKIDNESYKVTNKCPFKGASHYSLDHIKAYVKILQNIREGIK